MDTVPSPTELKREEPLVVKSEPQASVSSDLKVIKCDVCDFVAENRTKFTAHMKSQHKKQKTQQGAAKEKIFPCDQCDYKATSKAHVKAHKRTIHDKIKGCIHSSSLEFVMMIRSSSKEGRSKTILTFKYCSAPGSINQKITPVVNH